MEKYEIKICLELKILVKLKCLKVSMNSKLLIVNAHDLI